MDGHRCYWHAVRAFETCTVCCERCLLHSALMDVEFTAYGIVCHACIQEMSEQEFARLREWYRQ